MANPRTLSAVRAESPVEPAREYEEAAQIAGEQPAPTGESAAAEELERREWIESIDAVRDQEGPERVVRLLSELDDHTQASGIQLPARVNTPYLNTIPLSRQPAYPGDLRLETEIENLIRWNAMAMVVRANRDESNIGGHISTFASCATLYEVGFNHFFRGHEDPSGGDLVYFQGHASPGNYARAFLEGRLSEDALENFRREIRSDAGISSYPHPWLMPEFWEFPTVSMGLGPIQAIYQARFMKYLEHRGLKQPTNAKVWAFVGDGECDEPETMGAITLATREKLDNLIFVVNCNLQRLDGPVRGNGKIIQELEADFRGIGWNVLKVLWGSEWDDLLSRDRDGILLKRLNETLDGEFLKYHVSSGAYVREHLFGGDPRLQELIRDYSDQDLKRLRVGGHDPVKIHAAYESAIRHRGSPTVILAWTIKGYGLGEAGEGQNVTHQQKKLSEDELRHFRDRFNLPISDDKLATVPFYRPPEQDPRERYLHDRRRALGGYLPERRNPSVHLEIPDSAFFQEFLSGSPKPLATTMAMVRLVARLLRDPNIGKQIVPIVPDEARTFGMDALFRQVGIYSSVGQHYEPVDRANVLYYRETEEGQLLEEGITEAGSVCSMIAAGTSRSNYGIPTIPFFFFYSMFGFQRIGDLLWAAGDSRARGFLVGGTAGRTTLAGEGLQHQDGNSHVLALPFPHVRAYEPAFAYEIAIIVEDGLRRMYQQNEDALYYLTTHNELYPQPPMPENAREGILRGMYLFEKSRLAPKGGRATLQLFGSGTILNEVIKAKSLLEDRFGIGADVWSVTSYKSLHQDALDTERWNMFHPDQPQKIPYVTSCFQEPGNKRKYVFVAALDYMKVLPDSIARWLPGRMISLGTDGFGRSDSRECLREFFEVNAKHIALAALWGLAGEGQFDRGALSKALLELDVDPEKPNPMHT